MSSLHRVALVAVLVWFGSSAALAGEPVAWPTYGGGNGALRFSTLADIRPDNLSKLEVAWVHHSGDVADGKPETPDRTAYEVTPILADGLLYFCSPFNRLFAVDPESGEERWVYDPHVDRTVAYMNQAVCRGVATWLDEEAAAAAPCRRRIFMGTNDARLIALDAATGNLCNDFGGGGQLDLARGVGEPRPGEYQVTSPPTITGDLIVMGSAVGDNRRVDAPSGVLRAFDVRSGQLRWAWSALPQDLELMRSSEAPNAEYPRGTANVWAPMVVDAERDLLFVPTGNPSPDFYGGEREGSDTYGSSVVALRASTGEVVWHFQTVHHDVWDYDVPSQPTLIELERDGMAVPALVQATKMGHLFVLHRETGAPLFPVEERPVPQGGVPGEHLSPTQPFPVKPPPLIPARISEDDAWGLTFWDRSRCRKKIRSLRNDGIFTPPSLQGSLIVPGSIGGSNWGGVAFDPLRKVLIANVTHMPFIVTLFPAEEYASRSAAEQGKEIRPQSGTPYGLRREQLLSPLGIPCVKPPWGMLTAVDLASGDLLWQVPHGTLRDVSPLPIHWRGGHADTGRSPDHGERAGVHWSGDGQLHSRLRHPHRGRTLAGPLGRCRHCDSHDLSGALRRKAVRRHRRGRPQPRRHAPGRHARRLCACRLTGTLTREGAYGGRPCPWRCEGAPGGSGRRAAACRMRGSRLRVHAGGPREPRCSHPREPRRTRRQSRRDPRPGRPAAAISSMPGSSARACSTSPGSTLEPPTMMSSFLRPAMIK